MQIKAAVFVKIAVAVFFLQSFAYAGAETCSAPDAAKSAEVVSYMMKKYQISSSSSLVLATSAKANDACFWKMEYATTASKQRYVLYLSPDRKYLSPILYDMSLDPVAETHAKDLELSKELLVGANSGMGSAAPQVTIVEFSDFECPFCKKMTEVLEKEVLPKEGDKVKVVFRNFPLPMHPWAKQAAEIAECAALQKPDAFWAMHDFFFQNQQTLNPGTIQAQSIAFAATRKDLDQTQFQSCVDRELGLGPVTQDQQMGDRLGIHGTPGFFVNGVRFEGYKSADEMIQLIESAAKGELVSSPSQAASPGVAVAANTGSVGLRNAAVACAPATRGGTVNAQ